MTLECLIEETLTTAAASLTLARQIRTQLQASDYLWRRAHRFTTGYSAAH